MPSAHHYVPQWYQRRFLRHGETRFNYLDLSPAVRSIDGQRKYQRRALLKWGPARCFFQHDLYTLKLGSWSSDDIEQRFFGDIDRHGHAAVPFFQNYRVDDGAHDAVDSLVPYMDAQRIRTPRGLDWLTTLARPYDRNMLLLVMQRVYQTHTTMWMEGVWEIVSAKQSATKFLVSDNPVTFYNAKAFPGAEVCKYPNDVRLQEVGTRTIFPLDLDTCLIMTHTEFVRDPWANPRRPRANARAYQPTLMSLLDVQFGRELDENEVRRINYIIKSRAARYIAAAEMEWLYPERFLASTHWSRLDEDWFLLPNLYKVIFGSGMAVGYKDGSSWAMDEYGREPGHPQYQDKRQHQREWATFQRAKKEWGRKRSGRSRAHVHELRHDAAYDRIMDEDLARTRSPRS
jgi:hypothetical protein